MVQIATIAESMPGSLKLCYGESDMPTPAFICDAATEAMRGRPHLLHAHRRLPRAARGHRRQDLRAAPGPLRRAGDHGDGRRHHGDLCGHPRARRPRRQRRHRLPRLRDLLERRDHVRRRAAPGAAGARAAIGSSSISIASARAIDRQHADADRQQPVESHRLGDQRGRAARAGGDRRARTTS